MRILSGVVGSGCVSSHSARAGTVGSMPASPPCGFIAAVVNLAMMASTQRDRELVADFAAESAALGKAQMMGIRGLSAADQARVLGDRPDVIPVANPARLRQG